MTIFAMCKDLIEIGKFDGLKEKIGILLLGDLLTQDEFTQLIALIPQKLETPVNDKPQEIANTSEIEQPVEDTEILK